MAKAAVALLSGGLDSAVAAAEARAAGARTVELNLEPSLGSDLFDEARHGPATSIVPAFVSRLLA